MKEVTEKFNPKIGYFLNVITLFVVETTKNPMVQFVTLVTTLVRSAGLSGLPGLDPHLSCVWSTIDLASLTCSKKKHQ